MAPEYFGTRHDQRLIQFVRDHPILYDSNHPDFNCPKNERELVFQVIADELGRSPQRCKSRWLNMRDQFRRVLRMRIEQPDEYTDKKYRYEEELQFLIPHYKLHKIEENVRKKTKKKQKRITKSSDEESTYSENNIDDLIRPDFELQSSTSKIQGTKTDDCFIELNPSDPLDIFLMTIGSSLKSFSPYYLNQAKSKIFEICQDYELQQITERPGVSGGKL